MGCVRGLLFAFVTLMFATFSRAAGDPLPAATLWRILDATPQLVRESGPYPAVRLRYLRVRGALAGGYVNPALTDYGHLRDGQDVLIVPLGSGGSGGVFFALLYTRLVTRPRFVGYLRSRSGHLAVSIEHGELKAVSPLYAAHDAQCCPSGYRSEIYALRGIRLKRVRVAIAR